MLIKICGLTSCKDVEMVSAFSPDYLGFIFFEKSPRHISCETIEKISSFLSALSLEKTPKKIGVFVNPTLEYLEKRAPFIDGFQLHGDESVSFCKTVQKKFPNHEVWKAFRIKTSADLQKIKQYTCISTLVIDAFSKNKDEYGGSGISISKEILSEIKQHIYPSQKFFIAGGISADNKKEIFSLSQADGIDLSSSCEISAGIKSQKKCEEFFM